MGGGVDALFLPSQFQQLWLTLSLLMFYRWRKEWNCATPLTALIPAAPTAAAGMCKAVAPKKKRRTDCEKLCNMSVRPARSLQSQEMETTLTVQFPQCFVAHSVSLRAIRLNETWVLVVADRLYGLTSHHQWVYDGSRPTEAAPLLCLFLSFLGRGQEPWPHFLLGLLTSIPLSVRMCMCSGDSAHLAAVISNLLYPSPPKEDYYMCW